MSKVGQTTSGMHRCEHETLCLDKETSVSEHSISSTVSSISNSHDENFRVSKHAENSLKVMEKYLHEQQFTDVTLIAGNRRFPAHRLVLSAGSEYFAAMFTSSLKESDQEEIEMVEVDGDALWALICYCYTGCIAIRDDSVETLLATARLLQINPVVKACCQFLRNQLHPKSEDLNVPSEETIFHALMTWLEYDLENRQKDASRLLSLVKLPLLSPEFIADNIESNEMFKDHKVAQELVMEALKYHLLPERRPLLQSERTKPRKATVGHMLVVGGMNAKKGDTSIDAFSLRDNSWNQIATMSGKRLQFGAAVMEKKLIVAGGRDGLKTLNTVECLDFSIFTWTTLSSMHVHRHGLGVAVLGGPLYAVGGHDGWSFLNTVERWDPNTRQWSSVAPMSIQRSTVGVAVLNDKLYAVGGRDISSCLSTVECYDPHTDRWNRCAPMSKRRGGVGVGVVNGCLYALGGHDAPATNPKASRFDCVERYDPKSNTWTRVASMSSPRDAIGVCVLGDRLMAVGGYDGQKYLTLVEAYDPYRNEWDPVAPLKAGRAGPPCVVVQNLPDVDVVRNEEDSNLAI
ncbi:kelch-like protein 5 isoform X2 [Augochlora pura]